MWEGLQVHGGKVDAVGHVVGQEVLPGLMRPAIGRRVHPASAQKGYHAWSYPCVLTGLITHTSQHGGIL